MSDTKETFPRDFSEIMKRAPREKSLRNIYLFIDFMEIILKPQIYMCSNNRKM